MLTSNDTDAYGKVLWEGKPKEVRLSPTKQLTGYLAYGVSVSSMAFCVVRTLVFYDTSVTPLLFALVSATVGALVHAVPHLWRGSELYRVTQSHVVLIRGPFNRVIERGSINFARIYWSPRLAHVGTLELVRAVPMGVFNRRLALRLESVESPDGVWAIIRGEQAVASSGHEHLPIAQRLDRGERILWYARPLPTFRAYLPMGSHQWYQFAMALGLFAFAGYLGVSAVTVLDKLSRAGVSANSLLFWSLVTALSTTARKFSIDPVS